MDASFCFVWGTLILFPPIAWQLAGRNTIPLSVLMAWGSGLLLPVVIAILAKLTFRWPGADLAMLCAAYGGFCALSFCCRRIGVKFLRRLVTGLVLVPMLLGYFLATFGVIGLGMIVSEYNDPPRDSEVLVDGLICHKKLWGAAMTDSGYSISVYQPVAWFFLRRIGSISVNETLDDRGASCGDVLERAGR